MNKEIQSFSLNKDKAQFELVKYEINRVLTIFNNFLFFIIDYNKFWNKSIRKSKYKILF